MAVSALLGDVSWRGGSGSLGSGRSAGYALGESRTPPQWNRRGGRSDRIPGGFQRPFSAPRTVNNDVQSFPQGSQFSPARTATSRRIRRPVPVPCTRVMGVGTSGRRGPRAHGRSRAPWGARATGASGPLGASGVSLSCGRRRPRGFGSPGRTGAQVLRRASGRAIGAQGLWGVGSKQGCGQRAERSV